jgi:UDP-N-acetylmuramoyl-tripeptide--D-alanyl-D-alanine ligase
MDVEMKDVERETRGEALGAFHPASLNRVSTDTRLVEKNDLFFALKGARFDGHDFIEEALGKGASHFVVSDRKRVKAEWLKKADFVAVQDTLTAYGDLARWWRSKFRAPAVAITGSAGKTTVKELLAHLLSAKFKVLKNRGTENNLVGVPKTLFGLDGTHEVLVLEMGTNAPGEIEKLSSIIRPQAAVLTQIGASHLEGLKDLEGVREEKLSLLKYLDKGGVLVVNAENPMLAAVKTGFHRLVRCGFDRQKADATAERVSFDEKGSAFYWKGLQMKLPLMGRHNVVNALLALECALALGVEKETLRKALESFKPVPGRFNLKTFSDVTFIDDSYNANPPSFRAAIETLKELRTKGRKAVICGDMLELGSHAEELHREIGALLAHAGIGLLIAAGKSAAWIADEAVKQGLAKDNVHLASDSAEAGKLGQKLIAAGDLVLVKGSRGMQMEKVLECFTNSFTR